MGLSQSLQSDWRTGLFLGHFRVARGAMPELEVPLFFLPRGQESDIRVF
jgi:hypothetical protein